MSNDIDSEGYRRSGTPELEIPFREVAGFFASSEWTLLAAFSLLLALLATGASIFTYQKSRIFLHNAKKATAEIVEIKPKSTIIQYNVDGVSFEYELLHNLDETQGVKGAGSRLTSLELGDTISVYFNEENPSEVREVLSSELPTSTILFIFVAGVFWTGFGAMAFLSYQASRKFIGVNKTHVVDTACVFVALEGTSERVQSARRIRLVCRWVHPETGQEWLLRSTTLHPTELPNDLEVGATLPCRVDFENPIHHEIEVA